MLREAIYLIFAVLLCFFFSAPTHSGFEKAAPELNLTPAEKNWLDNHPTIRVGIMPAWPPMNFVDRHGNPTGIGVDYLKALNERLSLKLQIVPKPFKESMELVKSRKLDALMDITPKEERKPFFHFTAPYLKIPHVIVARKKGSYYHSESDLAHKTIALENGFYNVKYFKKEFPSVTVREYNSTSEALGAVSRGEADAYAGNRAAAIYLIEHELMANLQVQGRLQKGAVILAMGVRKDWPELASILNKAFASLSEEETRAIQKKWVSAPELPERLPEIPSSTELDRPDSVIRGVSIAFFLALTAGLILWIILGRPTKVSIRTALFGVLFIFAGLTISIGAFSVLLLDLERMLTRIEEHRYQSIKLAWELKQSSDDLTRFAQAFAVTGDPKYESYYLHIIDVRDGVRPHPKSSSPAYWDHVASGAIQPDMDGKTYSIKQRMVELGLSEVEKEKLSLAKKNSDDLIKLETAAMHAVKGLFKNTDGAFSLVDKPDRRLARDLVFGKEYHEAKSRIMKPIDEFFHLLDYRSTLEIRNMQKQMKMVILSVSVLTIFTVLFAAVSFFYLKRRIINPLYTLKAGATILEKGGLLSPHPSRLP